ncbi:unnamed protein product [Calypogeia fissa]
MVQQQTEVLGPSQSGAISLPYPDRFFAAASFAGFAPASQLASKSSSISLSDDTTLLLYSLYQQATVGPCNVAKPWSWNVVEHAKWTSWNQLAKMPSTEAMRLFVRTLEEEDADWFRKAQEEKSFPGDQNPEWWSNAHDDEIPAGNEQPTSAEAEKLNPGKIDELSSELGEIIPPAPVFLASNGTVPLNGHGKTLENEVLVDEPETAKVYNCWISPTILGRRPAARYQHAAAVVGKKMFVIGGNYNGRYLSDVHELDLDTFTWSKVELKLFSSLSPKQSTIHFPPCAGHSLVLWDEKLLMVAGHSKESSDLVTVRSFDPASASWSILPSFGQSPVARGGQTVTKVGSSLVMFGGEDSKRRLYNDLNILDLETMTWDAIEAGGSPPSPRSDHAAALHADRYLFVFGGGSHSSCFNDLHVLDFETMVWSQPLQQGFIPSPRAGHAAVTIGDHWYIMGGGDNKSGISDTLVLNMSNLVWDIVATEEGRTSIASEGLSVVASFADGAASLISFGGYNGRYSNEVHILRTGSAEKAKHKVLHSPAAAAAAASTAAAFAVLESQAAISTPLLQQKQIDSPQPLANESPKVQSQEADIQTFGKEISVQQIVEKAGATLDDSPSVTAQLQVQLQVAQLEVSKVKQELAIIVQEYSDLEKELVAVCGQLAAEQSRCFRLEVDVLELRQKVQAMDSLQRELDLVRRQRAAAEEAAANAAQKPPGVWGWLVGHQQDQRSVEV